MIGLAADKADAQTEFRLDVQDRLRIIVSDWSEVAGEARTRLSGEFTVDAGGRLSLPLIGEVVAAGQTPAALGETIAARMQARARLINPPVASVEIVQYRPFYVLGFVENPGEYPFRPALSVLQAVAVAGGFYRARDAALMRLDRDAIAAAGELGLQRARFHELVLRRARLQAELDDRDGLTRPQELGEDVAASAVLGEEQVLRVRREVLQAAIRAQEEIRRMAEQQVASLENQMRAQRQRMAVVTREADELRALRSRGLATAARDLSVSTAAAEVEARLRELETQILRTRQVAIEAGHGIRRLQDERRIEVLADLHRTDAGIEEAARRMRIAAHLVREAEATARAMGLSGTDADAAPAYVLIRREGERSVAFPATEATPVRPGDILRVLTPPRAAPPPAEGGRG